MDFQPYTTGACCPYAVIDSVATVARCLTVVRVEALWKSYPTTSGSHDGTDGSGSDRDGTAAGVPGANAVDNAPIAVKAADDDEGRSLYDLFGVVNHLGGMFGGHYTAYARCEVLHQSPPNNTVTDGSNPSAIDADPSFVQPSYLDPTQHGLDIWRFYAAANAQGNQSMGKVPSAEISQAEYRASISPDPIQVPDDMKAEDPGLAAVLRNLSSNLDNLMERCAAVGQNRWFKFDDEFVAELTDAPSLLYQTVVSGRFRRQRV